MGVSVDSRDHIWVVHRPRGALAGWQEECCVPAPAVIEFDQQGNVVQGWGGPPADEMPRPAALPWQPPRDHTWVQSEHNIFVDHEEVLIAPPPSGTTPRTVSLNDGRGGMPPTHIGTVFDLAFSRDPRQRFVFVADGVSEKVWILRRSDLEIVGSIGHAGHWGGAFSMAHNLGVDSANNLYVSESAGGHRVQRFMYRGMAAGPRPNP